MLNANHAIQAYKTASRYRSQRDQEADVFRQATGGLKSAAGAGPIQQIRALADNRRLWMMVIDLMRDPANALPEHEEAGRAAGADRHLTKPIGAQALINALAELGEDAGERKAA